MSPATVTTDALSANAARRSAEMSAAITLAPSPAKRIAVASPMPAPAPVTIAVLPAKRSLMLGPLGCTAFGHLGLGRGEPPVLPAPAVRLRLPRPQLKAPAMNKPVGTLIADYGSEEAAMRDYCAQGEARAMALGNRGPIRFTPEGDLHPEIREAYSRCGFYVFTGV